MLYAQPTFTPVYGKFPTFVEELKVGDIFWYRVMIDPEDVADPGSETAKDVRNYRRTKRLVVVVCTSPLLVLYLATFNRATVLPSTLADKSVWYPVDEANSHWHDRISYSPVETEPRQCFAQWVNIRRLYAVHEISAVDRIGGFHFPRPAVERLAAALLTRTKVELIRPHSCNSCIPLHAGMECRPNLSSLVVKL